MWNVRGVVLTVCNMYVCIHVYGDMFVASRPALVQDLLIGRLPTLHSTADVMCGYNHATGLNKPACRQVPRRTSAIAICSGLCLVSPLPKFALEMAQNLGVVKF
jgi:hypothetical protein